MDKVKKKKRGGQINSIRIKRHSPTPNQTGANKFNKKDLKRENQFKKKESSLS